MNTQNKGWISFCYNTRSYLLLTTYGVIVQKHHIQYMLNIVYGYSSTTRNWHILGPERVNLTFGNPTGILRFVRGVTIE